MIDDWLERSYPEDNPAHPRSASNISLVGLQTTSTACKLPVAREMHLSWVTSSC
jgi:hypothetical protein